MTDERGIGPMPPIEAAGAGSTAPAAPVPVAPGTRLAGAILAAILAAIAVFLTVRADAVLTGNSLDSPIGTVFGPDGIGSKQPLSVALVWLVGPLAAGIAGFLFAVPAVQGVDGAGLWMGLATYVAAIAIAPIALVPQASADLPAMLRAFPGLPILWMASGVLLAPLCAVCLVAGPIWSTTLRRTVGGPGAGTSTRTFPIWPIVALGVLMTLGWVMAMAVLGSIDNMGGGLVD